jgi:hypothetical protein
VEYAKTMVLITKVSDKVIEVLFMLLVHSPLLAALHTRKRNIFPLFLFLFFQLCIKKLFGACGLAG